ncbi:MAG: DUF3885 domain-containing protein [Flavisolibacter sp.]
MNTMRQELEDYFSIYFPHIQIDSEITLSGQITVRFGSTEDEFSETEQRIRQAVERGSLIFRDVFGKLDRPLWILVYEYEDVEMFEYDSNYFFQQFTPGCTSEFETNEETVNARLIGIDDKGSDVFEKARARITIGKAYFRDLEIEPILRGIANKENDIQPAIGQSVYFFDPVHHTGFHMFDDSGFFVWATEVDKLRPIYNAYNHWISEYTREDIEPFFQ